MKKYNIEKNAYIIPAVDGDFVGDGRSTHGIFVNNENSPSYYSHLRAGNSWRNYERQVNYIKNTDCKEEIRGTWLYAGIYLQPFGHFLSESIHRLWYLLEKNEKIDGILFNSSYHQKNVSFQTLPIYAKFVLEHYINKKNIKVKFVNKLSIVDKIIIPEPGSQLGKEAEKWYTELPDNYFIGEKESNKSPKVDKIIISRSNYSDIGRVIGIDFFWKKLMREYNFKIINPEEHTIENQVKLLQKAKTIIWEEGSAIHLLELFKKISSKNILLSRRLDRRGDFSLSCFLERKCSSFCHYGEVTPINSTDTPEHNQLSFITNPASFALFLKKELELPDFKFNYNDFKNFEYKDIMSLSLSKRVTRTYLVNVTASVISHREKTIKHIKK